MIILYLGIINNILCQDAIKIQDDIQVNYLMEFDANGNRYGIQFEYNRLVFLNEKKSYKLSWGGSNEFFVKDERDIQGITGNTISNVLGLAVSNNLYFTKSKKFFFSSTLYTGWGYRRTKANYTNEQFQIDKDYKSSFNYLAFGAYWKLGYQVKDKISIQVIGKTDFSRLIDEYEPTIFERPGFMYGVGMVYSLQ